MDTASPRPYRSVAPWCMMPGTAEPAPERPARRHDGWTPERIRTFLETLAECGVVEAAARAAGMSRRSAYNLRNRAEGRAFNLAWNAALVLARRRIADELMSRAIHGCDERIVRKGKVVAERHRFDPPRLPRGRRKADE